MKAIPTTSLRDPSVRAAAEVIDARIGKKNNREITLEDLQEAQKIVDETLAGDADQVAKWHPDELSILRSELPQLWKRMNAEPSTKPRHEAKFSALVVDTLKDPKIRQAARVIAEQIGPERFEVNITDVIETRRYFKEKREGQAEFSNPSLAKKLEAAIANDTFDPQAFQSLAVFMTTGAGGLASHGPM